MNAPAMRYGYLFEQMVRRELRQKYKGSALGVLWYFINPLVLMGAYALVFSVMLKFGGDIPDYPLFLLVGIVVWVFFSQALLTAAPSFVRQAALVRKVPFPRELVPGSVATVQMITFSLMLAMLAPAVFAIRGTLDWQLALLPAIWIAFFAFVLGLSLTVAALHAHYRDVEPVLGAVLLPWFFVTPIFFRVEDLPGASSHPFIADLMQWANPVAPFIDAVRQVVFWGQVPSVQTLAYIGAAGAIALVTGWLVHKRMERDLAVVL